MRYIILVLLNLPIVLLAFTSLLVSLKTGKISRSKFLKQSIVWLAILLTIAGSYPIYNMINGDDPFLSESLSLLDMIQTTFIIYLIYIVGRQRQRLDNYEEKFRDLHKEVSIKLSQIINNTR